MAKKPTHTAKNDCPHCHYLGQFTVSEYYDHLMDFYLCDSGLFGMSIVMIDQGSRMNLKYVFQVEELRASEPWDDLSKAARGVLSNPKVRALITRRRNKNKK